MDERKGIYSSTCTCTYYLSIEIENKKGDELPKEETKPDKEEDKNDDSSQLGPVDPRVQTDAPMDNPTKTTPTTTATPTETKDTVKGKQHLMNDTNVL